MTEPRPRRTNEIAATGQQVAANVRRLRNARQLSAAALAQLLTEHGRPFVQSAVANIEAGRRRVDVDDLMALAVVLNVSPTMLLLPPDARSTTEATGAGTKPAHEFYRWADRQWPLEASTDPETLRRQLLDLSVYGGPAGIPAYVNVDQAVRDMSVFGRPKFQDSSPEGGDAPPV